MADRPEQDRLRRRVNAAISALHSAIYLAIMIALFVEDLRVDAIFAIVLCIAFEHAQAHAPRPIEAYFEKGGDHG